MANHEKIYGICENKCQHEVYRKDDADSTFLKKTDANSLYAKKNHATNLVEYGVATSRLYGHVRITDALDLIPQISSGIALQASAGKELNDKISLVNDKTDRLADSIKLPVNAVLSVSNSLNNPDWIAQTLGYGSWEYLGVLELGSPNSNVYFYKRTA